MKKTSANTILKKATEILSRPNGWTKGGMAKDSDGWHVPIDSDKACSFCSLGAVNRAAVELGLHVFSAEAEKARDKLRKTMDQDIMYNNDRNGTKLPQILIAFDLAQHQPAR